MILTMPWRPSPGSFDSVGPLPGSNNRAGKQAVPGLSGPCAVATARSLSQWSQLRRQRRIVVFPGGPKDPGPQTRDTAMPIGEAPARSRCVTNSATARAVRRTSSCVSEFSLLGAGTRASHSRWLVAGGSGHASRERGAAAHAFGVTHGLAMGAAVAAASDCIAAAKRKLLVAVPQGGGRCGRCFAAGWSGKPGAAPSARGEDPGPVGGGGPYR